MLWGFGGVEGVLWWLGGAGGRGRGFGRGTLGDKCRGIWVVEGGRC